MKLVELQQALLAWLQQGDERIKGEIAGSSQTVINLRLEIYANAYRLRLIEALGDTFPALHTLLGDERFFQLASDYIDANPSQHFSLRYFGHRLSQWLENYSLADSFPIIVEMTAFEWGLREAFDAADKKPMEMSELVAIPLEQWDSVVFSLHPSIQRLNLNWNVPQLWKVIDEEDEPIAMEQNDFPVAWLIWRSELRTWFRSVDVDEAWALEQAEKGAGFAEICAGLTEWVDEQHAAQRAAGFVQGWIEQGLIIAAQIK